MAIPQYQDYVTRAKWQDNNSQVESYKLAIAECLQNNNGTKASCNTIALGDAAVGSTFPTATKNLASLTYTGGVMTLTGTAAVGSCVVTITPNPTATSVTWTYATTTCTKAKTGY